MNQETPIKAGTKQPVKQTLSVKEFPWKVAKDLVGCSTSAEEVSPEEFAVAVGIFAGELRAFFKNDDLTEISGDRIDLDEATLEAFKARPDVGSFGIVVTIEPADLNLYRQLLPEEFSIPEKPLLSLGIVDYNQPNPIARYSEAVALLKAKTADGEETWWVHSMPLDNDLMLALGHDWGMRKRIYDLSVTRENAEVREKNGDLYMALELESDPWPEGADGLIPAEACGGLDDLAVIHPRHENLVLRFLGFVNGDILEEEQRMVKITVNPDLDWAGLVPDNMTAPGRFLRYARLGPTGVKKVRG